jgi:GTP-binding protein HflX
VPADRFVHPELARQLTELSRSIHRQVGLMVDRRGRVSHVIVGDAHKLFIPDLRRHRAGTGRFRGLRLVHTHLRGEGLSQDDLTDLALLRLDAVVVIQAQLDGLPGWAEVGTLSAASEEGESAQTPWTVERIPSIHKWSANFLEVISELESRFSRRDSTRKIPGADGAIIIGVTTRDPITAAASLDELERLAKTAGLQVMDRFLQVRRKPDGKTIIGKGKLQEILVRAMQLDAEVLIFDSELSPSQLRNIATITELAVVDRTQLILDIFARRASTRDGKLQVELAQLKYILPRLAGRSSAMSRLAGGIGGRGPGETKLEVDRRRAKDRLAHLQKQVKKLASQRQGRRQRRLAGGVPTAAIVGYTNAGKSTLLNALTGASVLTEDKLFATLDPTTRRLRFPDERELVLTDTVGFIRDLPRDLVAAFKATLEELEEADLLLHVVDVSNPAFEEQIDAVDKILDELELQAVERLIVLNKVDAAPADLDIEAISRRFGAVAISALDRKSLRPLTERLIAGIAPSERGWRWDAAT